MARGSVSSEAGAEPRFRDLRLPVPRGNAAVIAMFGETIMKRDQFVSGRVRGSLAWKKRNWKCKTKVKPRPLIHCFVSGIYYWYFLPDFVFGSGTQGSR